jgi:hypothetical protein
VGVPAALLREAGLILLPYVAFVVYVSTRQNLARPAIWAVIVCNVLWMGASVALLVGPWIAPPLPVTLSFRLRFRYWAGVDRALFAGLQFLGLQRQTFP